MSTPENVASDLEQMLGAAPAKKKEEFAIVLASKSYLDRKILGDGQAPRLMDAAKDVSGNVLIQKYEKLTKPMWSKYRSKPQCRPFHFVCESPLFIINDLNTTYLIPEDFQFLGALWHLRGNDSVADQFFAEALKASSTDSFINAGVFRYRRGERGVLDNFRLAKKFFERATGVLHMAPLTPDEAHQRRRLCADAIDEIDYRFAPAIDKFFRFFIRLLTFRFEPAVTFIGAAKPKEPPEIKLKQLMDSIQKREFDHKREAAKKFMAALRDKIPDDEPHLAGEMQEIQSEYGNTATPELLDVAVTRLEEFYTQNMDIFDRADTAAPAAVADAQEGATDASVQAVVFQLANFDEIEPLAAKYKLASVGELVDLVSKPAIDKAVLAWLLRDKIEDATVMRQLHANPSISDEIRKLIAQRHPFFR